MVATTRRGKGKSILPPSSSQRRSAMSGKKTKVSKTSAAKAAAVTGTAAVATATVAPVTTVAVEGSSLIVDNTQEATTIMELLEASTKERLAKEAVE